MVEKTTKNLLWKRNPKASEKKVKLHNEEGKYFEK